MLKAGGMYRYRWDLNGLLQTAELVLSSLVTAFGT
jgi:hypothetical protein